MFASCEFRQRGERAQRKEEFDRHIKEFRKLQGEFERGTEIATFKIPDCLKIDADSFGQFFSGQSALRT